MVLVKSDEADGCYVTGASSCNCSAAICNLGKLCKHSWKRFSQPVKPAAWRVVSSGTACQAGQGRMAGGQIGRWRRFEWPPPALSSSLNMRGATVWRWPPTCKLGRLAKVDEFIGLLQEMKKESKELFAELFPASFRRWFVYRESKNLLFNLISNHVLYAKAFVYQKQPSYDMQIVLYTM